MKVRKRKKSRIDFVPGKAVIVGWNVSSRFEGICPIKSPWGQQHGRIKSFCSISSHKIIFPTSQHPSYSHYVREEQLRNSVAAPVLERLRCPQILWRISQPELGTICSWNDHVLWAADPTRWMQLQQKSSTSLQCSPREIAWSSRTSTLMCLKMQWTMAPCWWHIQLTHLQCQPLGQMTRFFWTLSKANYLQRLGCQHGTLQSSHLKRSTWKGSWWAHIAQQREKLL